MIILHVVDALLRAVRQLLLPRRLHLRLRLVFGEFSNAMAAKLPCGVVGGVVVDYLCTGKHARGAGEGRFATVVTE